ncbi:hypothetical protein BWQ96_07887 [Gracilariopsis chorda]|uniref:Glycosyltransferase family 92 protein n=1 Tax=Gracilariopsis chorda TaxID=448386 RepID=A0A2V3IJW5_9FLOR|nr:hypothetical protein BWQ96_07887 [Gracilariopsis chorda]|eukprot:PXF42367.1 hypothetical protein BWQ96_07887 [Gracilariopsis chorda]
MFVNSQLFPFVKLIGSAIPKQYQEKKKWPWRLGIVVFTCLYLFHFTLSILSEASPYPQSGENFTGRWFRPRDIVAENGTCAKLRYERINSLQNSSNNFIPYLCYNHNNKFITMLGMSLKRFDKSQLAFFINGYEMDKYTLHDGQAAFAFNARVRSEWLRKGRNQILSYTVHGCSYHMECTNYFERRREEFNMCVYTMRSVAEVKPFLDFYSSFVDRIFIYNTNPKHSLWFKRLNKEAHKYRAVGWYLKGMRDAKISKRVYHRLITHRVGNSRNYPRDLQKMQTNDCMYRNRDTDMLLMVDDDEYLNYHNRTFYRLLYGALKYQVDDILFKRNFCNSTVGVVDEANVDQKPMFRCEESRKKRLEKGIVLPKNCPLYEIHRCVTKKSYFIRGKNIYAAHKAYPAVRKEVRERMKRERL